MSTKPDDEMDAVFGALASAPRRRILDVLQKEPGCNVNRVCEFFDIGRIAVMKHLDVLEAANLVLSERVGRERRLYFNPVPIHLIYDRWTTEFSAYWAGQLDRREDRGRVPRAHACRPPARRGLRRPARDARPRPR